jgi:hypothetical protein
VRMHSTPVFLVFALFGLSNSVPIAAQHDYKRASVCEILAKPRDNHLRYVAVDADLLVARPHGVVLADQKCPGKGLLPYFPSTNEDQTVASLEKSIRDGSIPLKSTGRFCGKIERDSTTKRLVLSLLLVLNIQPKNPSTTPPG